MTVRLRPPEPPIPAHSGWGRAPLAVLHTAAAVRHALVEVQPTTAWSRNLAGACGTATLVLCHLLRRQGFEPIPVTGTFFPRRQRIGHSHAWTLLDDLLIDVTVTQFGAYPPIWISDLAPQVRGGDEPQYCMHHVGALARHSIGTWAMRVPEVQRRAGTLRRRWTLLQLTTWTESDETETAAFARRRYPTQERAP